jgi:hypothetical protein
MEEAPSTIGVSLATAVRDWRYAKAWLHERLSTTDPMGNR